MTRDPAPSDHHPAISTLLELTSRLSEDIPLEDSLQAVTDAAIALLPGNHASIRLLDASHAELLSGARSGAGAFQRPMTFQRGEGLIGWVVTHREGVRVSDASSDPRFIPDPGQGFQVLSIVAEPLWAGGNVIGVLSVSAPQKAAFSEVHQGLARLLANCSAPPIERARLRRLAMTDDLTLAFNQRYLHARLHEELERATRNGTPLSLLLLDLDYFKRVNDAFGHAVGDDVLRLFADRVRATVRRIDVLVRRGGEEFVLLMPQTAREAAEQTAERLRMALVSAPLAVEGGVEGIAQTISIGVAEWTRQETAEAFEGRADAAMYRAKALGRNRVQVAGSEEVPLSRRPPPSTMPASASLLAAPDVSISSERPRR